MWAPALRTNPRVWTARKSFIVGTNFLFGCIVGSRPLGAILVDLRMGIAVSLTRWLMRVVVDFVFLWLVIKCFDWGRNKSGEEQGEEEEEDDSFF